MMVNLGSRFEEKKKDSKALGKCRDKKGQIYDQ